MFIRRGDYQRIRQRLDSLEAERRENTYFKRQDEFRSQFFMHNGAKWNDVLAVIDKRIGEHIELYHQDAIAYRSKQRAAMRAEEV